MLLSLQQPFIGKKKLHKRSKTITVLYNTYKQSKIIIDHHKRINARKSFSNDNILLIAPISMKQNNVIKSSFYKNVKTEPIEREKQNKLENSQTKQTKQNTMKFSSIKKMTERISKLINREIHGPQLLTYINRGSSRLSNNSVSKLPKQKSLQIHKNRNPQSSSSQQHTFQNEFQNLQSSTIIDFKKYQQIFPSYTNVVRQAEYLRLLKKSQNLNNKSFVPHYNWKEKLNRLKNMGNYGHIYKKNLNKQALDKSSKLRSKGSLNDNQSRLNSNRSQLTIDNHQINSSQIQKMVLQAAKKITIDSFQTGINKKSLQRSNPFKKFSHTTHNHNRSYTTNSDYYPYPQTGPQTCIPQRYQSSSEYMQKYQKRFSQTKYYESNIIQKYLSSSPYKISHKKKDAKQWNFQPWQIKKQNNGQNQFLIVKN